MNLTWVDLTSTSLARAAYDGHALLRIQFQDGSVYDYFDVPPPVFHALLAAPSSGQFFNRSIRPRFLTQRLQPAN